MFSFSKKTSKVSSEQLAGSMCQSIESKLNRRPHTPLDSSTPTPNSHYRHTLDCSVSSSAGASSHMTGSRSVSQSSLFTRSDVTLEGADVYSRLPTSPNPLSNHSPPPPPLTHNPNPNHNTIYHNQYTR